MEIFAGLILISLVAAFVALIVSPRTARSLDTFAAGFLPYRSAGWPQGVQEEEPVRWSWSALRGRGALDGDTGTGPDDPEVMEIAGPGVPAASAVLAGLRFACTEAIGQRSHRSVGRSPSLPCFASDWAQALQISAESGMSVRSGRR